MVVPFERVSVDQTNMTDEEQKDFSKRPINEKLLVGRDECIKPLPTDDQVRALMKGKSAAERKRFLIEIERQRQRQLEVQFTLERQKLLNDERWARRNVADREIELKRIELRQRTDTENLRQLFQDSFNIRIDEEDIVQNLHMHTLSEHSLVDSLKKPANP